MMLAKDDTFMQKWNGVVKNKLTKKIDIKRQIEEEIEGRNPIYPASAVRKG
ncbi:MAG: hypothetical protein NTV84_05365 [Methanoregula sp.]|nr:hypothetical protein [Methanoregula sp.]